MGEEEVEDKVTALGAALTVGNTSSKRIIRCMRRTQGIAIGSEIQAREVLANAKLAASIAVEAIAKGVDAGVLSPARIAVMRRARRSQSPWPR